MQYSEGLYPLACRNTNANASELYPWNPATLAALKAIKTYDGKLCSIASPRRIEVVCTALGGRAFYWSETCALDGDDQLIVIPDDRNSSINTDLDEDADGRWLAVPGQVVNLALPITYATEDAAILYTLPTGARLALSSLYWEVTTAFSGGNSSAIGVSTTKSTPTNWSTKGDLLGGSGGDVEATLIVGAAIAGTIGTDMDTLAKVRGALWGATDIFRFDRITSVFTAGAGNVHVVGVLLANAGA